MRPPRPVPPSPAATLVLLRARPEGSVEVLLIQRHGKSKFAPGDSVFPGGRVETEDMPPDAAAWCFGLTPEEARRRLRNVASGREALAYWVGAIRETFEEVGILLAYCRDGALLRMTESTRSRFEEHRRDCQRDGSAFWKMLRKERLRLATDRLVYFAHWITPEENPIRFDTRFFAAKGPETAGPATLLYGLAFENVIKAIIIRNGGAAPAHGKLKKWPGTGHGLLDLANLARIELTTAQRDLLSRLTAFVEWSGRYPVPKSQDKIPLKQEAVSPEWLPLPIQPHELAAVRDLYQTLDAKILES